MPTSGLFLSYHMAICGAVFTEEEVSTLWVAPVETREAYQEGDAIESLTVLA